MRNKKIVRLTESKLHRMIKESVNEILNESILGADSDYTKIENELYNLVSNPLMKFLRNYPISNNEFHRIGDKCSDLETYICNVLFQSVQKQNNT